MTTSPVLGLPFIASQQSTPEITHNEALVMISALLRGVKDKDLSAPPGAPADGDSYIVGAAPTGAWTGRANSIAVYATNQWRFVPGNDSGGTAIAMGAAQEGMRVFVQDENAFYLWSGAAWVDQGSTTASVFPAVDAGTFFVFEGDSKTADLGTLDPYSEFFQNDPAAAGLGTFANVAQSGADLADLVADYAANVFPYRPGGASNPSSAPAILSVWIGTNDFWDLVAQGYTDAADYFASLEAYWQNAVSDGFRVVAWTIDARGDKQTAAQEAAREAINALIRASQVPTWIVDPETVTKDFTNLEWWDADEIHYVENGNFRLAKVLLSTLLQGATQLSAALNQSTIAALQNMSGFVAGILAETDGDDFSDAVGAARLNAANEFTGGIQTINNNAGALPAPTAGFGTLLHVGGADAAVNTFIQDAFGSLNVYRARRANGTNAAKSAVTTNDNLFNISPQGYQTTTGAYNTGAGLQCQVTEPWTNTANGSKVVINAAENGAAVAAKWHFQGGAWAQAATGGNQGDGTFNATAVYDDGVLLCAPLHADNPKVHRLAFWDSLVPNVKRHRTARRHFDMLAEGFNPADPISWAERLRADKAVPGMPTLAEHERRYPVDPETGERMAVDKYSVHERLERANLAMDYMAMTLARLVDEVAALKGGKL